MEIKPIKNYKLPKFALLLAAAAVTGTMTACVHPNVEIGGVAPMPIETEVDLAGDEAVIEDTTPFVAETTTTTTESATNVVLTGVAPVPVETAEPDLAGDVAFVPDSDEDTDCIGQNAGDCLP